MVQLAETAFVIGFMIVTFLIGVYASRKVKTSAEYFGATKMFGSVVILLASFAAIMSAFGFVGGPGLVYNLGTSSLLITFAAGFGFALAYFVIGKRVRAMAELRDIGTLPDIVERRFRSPKARGMLAIILFIACWAYLGSQISGGGYVLAELLGLGRTLSVVAVFGIIIAYVAIGGMAANQLADAFNGAFMLVGVVGAVIGFFFITGGMENVTHMTATAGEISLQDVTKIFTPHMLDGWGLAKPGAVGLLVAWPVAFGIGLVGQPQVLQRMIGIDKPDGIRTVGLVSGLSYATASLLWMLLGLGALYIVGTQVIAPFANPDLAVFKVMAQLSTPIRAIIFAGLVGAVMSTASLFMIVASGAVARDIPRAFGATLSDSAETWLGRLATIVIGIGAIVFGLYGGELVAILGTFGWGTFISGTFPAVIVGLLWKGASKEGVEAGLFTAIVLNVVLLAGSQMGVTYPHGLPFYFIVISVVLTVQVVVSYMTDTASDEDIPERVKPVFEV